MKYNKIKYLQPQVLIILVEIAFVMIEYRQLLIALNHDHSVISAYHVQVIAAFVQFDIERHHVVVQHDFFLVLVVKQFGDYL